MGLSRHTHIRFLLLYSVRLRNITHSSHYTREDNNRQEKDSHTSMSVVLARVNVEDDEWVHPDGEESHRRQRIVYMYVNDDGIQLSPEFQSIVQAKEWYAEMMSDYPYE